MVVHRRSVRRAGHIFPEGRSVGLRLLTIFHLRRGPGRNFERFPGGLLRKHSFLFEVSIPSMILLIRRHGIIFWGWVRASASGTVQASPAPCLPSTLYPLPHLP